MERSTELAKRRVITEALYWELARCRRYDRVMSVLLIGLDHLPEDGSGAPSRKFASIGRVIRGGIRETDLVGIYGPAELLVLLPETSRAGAQVAAQRLWKLIQDQHISVADGSERVDLTVSIGVVGYPEDGREAGPLLDRAEDALAVARSGARNPAETS